MTSEGRYEEIIRVLHNNELSIPELLNKVLGDERLRENLVRQSSKVCEALHDENKKVVVEWALGVLRDELCEEVVALTNRRHGLHFNATRASADDLEGSFMKKAAEKMQMVAPNLWMLVSSLLDANPNRRRATAPTAAGLEHVAMQPRYEERDLGEIGGDADEQMDLDGVDEESDKEMEVDKTDEDPSGPLPVNGMKRGSEKLSKRRERAARRNDAVKLIKTVVCISIFLQSTNSRCNHLQSVLGLFFHSTSVPEKVIETLAHGGLSISLTAIHNAVKSLSAEASRKLKTAIRALQTGYAYDNFDMALKTSQPTVEHQSKFVSATSATAIPIYDAVNHPDALRCSSELWAKDPRNPKASQETVIVFDVNNLTELHQAFKTHRKKSPTDRLSPMRQSYAWHVRDILISRVPGFEVYREQNAQPEAVNQIPLHTTTQMPCRAMNIKESTPDGNIEVVEALLRQGGIGEPSDKRFNAAGGDQDMSEHVLLVHGDLLTKERLDSVRDTRRIEDTPKRRFQFVIFVMGLFHFKMACVEALWRIYIQSVASRSDPNSLFQHAGILRPDETGKIGSKPGFRRMHDLIHHDIWASMLDCWGVEAQTQSGDWSTLEKFAAAKPSWDTIVAMSENIIEKYVATTPGLTEARQKSSDQRDEIFENQTLRNRDELHYLELSHAMNAGDIGRVEETFLQWVYTFRAVGKHKYAWHTLETMFNLRKLWPADLAHLFRMNWLCNPTGKEHAFRGIDWVVERNNLYTKVIYGGSGSNRTIGRVIEESILIELYRECHITVENGFHLEHRTIRHASPNMIKTLKKLAVRFEEVKPHIFKAGREADHTVKDTVQYGMKIVQTTGVSSVEGDTDEPAEIEADDLGAE